MSQIAIRNLSVLAYSNGFTLWHYRAGRAWTDAPQTLAELLAPGAFGPAADMIVPGDHIHLSLPGAGAIAWVKTPGPNDKAPVLELMMGEK